MNLLQHQKPIGIITVLSGILATACMFAILVAVDFNSAALSDPLLVLKLPGANAEAARISMILDLFGYYLLLLPVIYLFHDWLKNKSAWTPLMSFCGAAYVLIGAIGAAILAVIWPKIIAAYPHASSSEQQILAANFGLVNDLVYMGMWNLLEMAFAAAWWLFVGTQLKKHGFRISGWISLFTGVACIGDAISGIIQSADLHELFLNLYIVLAIVWAFSVGILLFRKKLSSHTAVQIDEAWEPIGAFQRRKKLAAH